MLTAICDSLVAHGAEREDPRIQSIHRMLFVDANSMDKWVKQSKASDDNHAALQEDVVLNFCRLIPTYCDRSAYLTAILSPWVAPASYFCDRTHNPQWHLPLLAKDHFS